MKLSTVIVTAATIFSFAEVGTSDWKFFESRVCGTQSIDNSRVVL